MLTYARYVRLLRFVTGANASRCAGLLLLLVGAEVIGFAQTRDTASVFGTLTDAQAALIPGASITLTNASTGLARQAATNESGGYVFAQVPVGSYRISIEKEGFRSYQRTGIVVRANENVRIDVTLELGEIKEVITVDAAAAQVDTRSETLQQVVDSKRVVELPLNGRNPADLALLAPGVVPGSGTNTGDTGFVDFIRPRGQKILTVNGSRNNNLRFTLDGGEHIDTLTNFNLPFPFPEAVQEFSVQTSNMATDVGSSSAGSVNIVTKSGTNEIHGNAFWFLRNTALNATNFFSREEDQLKRNQAGFTLGGPIVKNKLFVFGGFQKLTIRQLSGSGVASTLTAAERRGDFSAFPGQLHNPFTGAPFPNNQIPSSLFSPAAQKLLTLSPVPGPDGLVRFSFPTTANGEQYIVRGDYSPTARHTLMLRYFRDNQVEPFKSPQDNIHAMGRNVVNLTDTAALSHSFFFSPTLLVHSQFSGTHFPHTGDSDFGKTYRDFGVNVRPVSNDITVSMGNSGVGLVTPNRTHYGRANYEYLHDWTWTKANHTLTWGLGLTWRQYNEDTIFNSSGAFDFDGHATGLGNQNGYDRADFMLGQFSFFTQNNGEKENRRQMLKGFHFGDSWRLNPHFTLNLGLRFEPYDFYTDTLGRAQTFDLGNYQRGVKSKVFLNAPPGLLYHGDARPGGGTIGRAVTEPDHNNLAPHFGFAWDPFGNGKTSIRGGYAIFYDAPALMTLNDANNVSPFSYSVQLTEGLLDDPYRARPELNRFPVEQFLPDTPFADPLFTILLDNKWVSPYSQNWNLTVERQFLTNTLLRVGYIGTKGTHLKTLYDQNPPIYNPALSLAQNRATIDERRRIKGYQTINRFMHGLNSSYHALQATVEKRYSSGLTASGSYTWSKTLDYVSVNAFAFAPEVNPFNFFLTRGPSDQNRTHRLVSSFVWDLPSLVSDHSAPVAKAILKDWRVSGIVTLQSGRPFGIGATGNPSAGAGGARVDLIGSGYPVLDTSRSKGEKIERYFDITRFQNPAPNTYGSLGRNALVGPGYGNVDLSLAKAFRLGFIGEAGRGELRFDFFNLFNATHLRNPVAGLTNPNFGKILGTDGDPRILQGAVKISF